MNTITLLDIYHAVECIEKGELFHFHENPNPLCPVGKNIHSVLDSRLQKIQEAMELELKSVTVQDLLNDSKKQILQNP